MNETFEKEVMPYCYRIYISTKEGQHMHTGAYHVKLVLSCAVLHSNSATHSNTRKPTPPYLLQFQGLSSTHMFIPLTLERGLSLVGRSDERSRNGGDRRGVGGNGGRDPPLTYATPRLSPSKLLPSSPANPPHGPLHADLFPS